MKTAFKTFLEWREHRKLPYAKTLSEEPNMVYTFSPLPTYPQVQLDPARKREVLQRVLEWAVKG